MEPLETVHHPEHGAHEVTGEVALVLLGRGWTRTPTPDPADPGQDGDGLPENAKDLVAWIGDNPDRANEALEAEQARSKPRTTVTDHITSVLDPTPTPDPADTGQED